MPAPAQIQQRIVPAQVRAAEEGSRTVELSFSSEVPVERWFGSEILSHDEGAVDFKRLLEVGTVLFNHGRDVKVGKIPIAKIDKAWIDIEQKKARAQITFDDDEDSDKIFQKVQKGMLNGISVGYFVSSWEEVAAGKTSANGRFIGPVDIAIRWEPIEISFEPTPADPSVGVGRSIEEAVSADGRTDITLNKEDRHMGEEMRNQKLAAVDEAAVREEAVKLERQRVAEVNALCRDFEVDPTEFIKSGNTVEQVRSAILKKLLEERQASPAATDMKVEREEKEKFREAASDAILMRGGRNVEKAADGAKDLRGMRLRDLAVECLIRAGQTNTHRLDDEQLFRAAITPDSQFTSILSNAVNKSMAIAYRAAQTTYQRWTGRGSNPDFKAATHYQISEAGDLQEMTQTGEFKFDEMSDQGVNKAIATFGRSFGITRQALINDDVGILTKVPETYVRAAGRGINRLVYRMLGTNPVIFDGVQLFDAAHNNLAAVAAAIAVGSVSIGRTAMRRQRNLRGNETLNIGPKFLLVPSSQETVAQQFVSNNLVPTTQNVINPFAGTLEVVADAELDDYSLTAWHLAASPADIDTIEVTYLNGDDMPKLESQVGFDFLGIKWRIYIDYGVTVLDYRGLYRNPGV